MVKFAWYHGDISRDVAENLLQQSSGNYNRGTVIFLVRKSNSSPKV
jgi:hypothetical protein